LEKQIVMDDFGFCGGKRTFPAQPASSACSVIVLATPRAIMAVMAAWLFYKRAVAGPRAG
jgi:hypothetical protein